MNTPHEPGSLVVITGASRGIGAACARRMAAPHRHIILLARTASDLEDLADELRAKGGEATAHPCDLSSAASAMAAAKDILETYGVPDTMVINAGFARDTSLLGGTIADIEQEMGVNYLAPVGLLRTLLPEMRDKPEASVIAVGSLTSLVPFPGNTTYAASKAALFSMMRSLYLEHDDDPVHIGVVLPGYTKTSMTEGYRSNLPGMTPEQVADEVARGIEERRWLVIPGMGNRLAASLFGAFPELGQQLLQLAKDVLVPSKIKEETPL